MGQPHAGHFDGAIVLGGFGGSGSALRGFVGFRCGRFLRWGFPLGGALRWLSRSDLLNRTAGLYRQGSLLEDIRIVLCAGIGIVGLDQEP